MKNRGTCLEHGTKISDREKVAEDLEPYRWLVELQKQMIRTGSKTRANRKGSTTPFVKQWREEMTRAVGCAITGLRRAHDGEVILQPGWKSGVPRWECNADFPAEKLVDRDQSWRINA